LRSVVRGPPISWCGGLLGASPSYDGMRGAVAQGDRLERVARARAVAPVVDVARAVRPSPGGRLMTTIAGTKLIVTADKTEEGAPGAASSGTAPRS
jgi:hypothetical protein